MARYVVKVNSSGTMVREKEETPPEIADEDRGAWEEEKPAKFFRSKRKVAKKGKSKVRRGK